MKNIFKGHTQDGSNWFFKNEAQYKELLCLIKHFRRKILFDETYNPKFNAITFWCDGAAIGVFNKECAGNFAISYDYYHPYYLKLTN